MKLILLLTLWCLSLGGMLRADMPLPATLEQQVHGIDNPTIGAPRSISNWTLALGKGSLRLSEGQVLPLLENGREVGFYFKGEGIFTLPIDQRDEIPVLNFNLKSNTSAKLRKEGDLFFLDLSIQELNFLSEGLQIPPFGASTSPADGQLLDSRLAFKTKYLVPGWQNRSHILLMARHNHPSQAAWYLDFTGKQGLWEFVRDPWGVRAEALLFGKVRGAMQRTEQIVDLLTVPISLRILGSPARRPLVPTYMLRHVDLDLTARASGACSYVAIETLQPQSSGMTVANLRLINTFFDGALGWKPHKLVLKKVTQNGQPLRFNHVENELLLELAKPTEAGQPIELRFEVEGDFLIHINGDNRWELGAEPWFPSTEMEGMRFTATTKIHSEKPFIPIASGLVVNRRVEGDSHYLETRVEQPTWSIFIVSGNYYFEEATKNGVTVRVASYAHKSINDHKLVVLAQDFIGFYDGILGPFPVKELNVVQRNSWGSGQAPSGFLFITNEAFNPLSNNINQWFSSGVNQRFAHEIAHQYWGNQVLIASMDENWLSEAFAQYCSALAIRTGKSQSDFENLLNTWSRAAKEHTASATIPTLWRAVDLGDSFSYNVHWALLYGKGPLLLYRIHKDIGDQAFVTLMRSFQKSLKGRPGTTQDLLNLLKIITKRDFTELFEDCFWGTAMPSR